MSGNLNTGPSYLITTVITSSFLNWNAQLKIENWDGILVCQIFWPSRNVWTLWNWSTKKEKNGENEEMNEES